jgi:hypothetical protein
VRGKITVKKLNCWEFMKCGREMEGEKAKSLGVCPVALETSADGLNGGINGGRICWIVADTCCKEKIRCSDKHGKSSCFSCEFRYKVTIEEGLLNVCEATGLFLARNRPSK